MLLFIPFKPVICICFVFNAMLMTAFYQPCNFFLEWTVKYVVNFCSSIRNSQPFLVKNIGVHCKVNALFCPFTLKIAKNIAVNCEICAFFCPCSKKGQTYRSSLQNFLDKNKYHGEKKSCKVDSNVSYV